MHSPRVTSRFRLRLGHWAGAAAVLALLTPLVAPSGASARPHQHRHQHQQQGPARIELPDGWQPEGITTDGRRLYAGSLADGAIWTANPRTGAGRVLAEGAPGRAAAGIDHDRWRDLLWAVGGPTGEVRAYDARSGRLLVTYTDPWETPGFLNDVAVTRRAVYVTDSVNAELVVIPLGSRHGHGYGYAGLPPASALRTVPLSGDVVYGEGFNLNGIVAKRHRLLAVQSSTGLLFRINPRTGVTREVDLHGASLVNGDGLELSGRTLYAVRNQDNLIEVLRLNRRLSAGRLVGELGTSDFDVPTTVAKVGHSLYAVNARFNTPPTPTTPYWITRLRLG